MKPSDQLLLADGTLHCGMYPADRSILTFMWILLRFHKIFFFANAWFIDWIWRDMSWKSRGGYYFGIYFTRLCQSWVSFFIGWKLILKGYLDFYEFVFVFASFLWPIKQYAKLEKINSWKQWMINQNRSKSIMAVFESVFLRGEN